jgi:two-component system phosphate regulon sensor histidine kinase PhoR
VRSIFTRSFRGFLVVIILLAVLAPLLVFGTIRSRFTSAAFTDLSRTAEALEITVAHLLEHDSATLDSLADVIGPRLGIRITIIARDGTVLADSEEQPDSMENHRTRPEVICAFNGKVGNTTRYSETLGREMLYAAVPVIVNDSIPAVIRTSLFFSDLISTLGQVGVDIAMVTSAVLLAGLITAWFFSRSISIPIQSIAGVTRKVEEGNFSARAAPCSIRELDQLSTDINGMIAKTMQLVNELSEQNAAQEAILGSIVEGLVVIDHSHEVVTANRSFIEMACGGNLPHSKDYLDYISVPEFRDFISIALHEDVPEGKVESDGKIYNVSVAPVSGTDRKVFTIRDVTELENLMRIKRDFAANLSHELRTPLTSIKGFSETLLEEADKESSGHIETILRNTDRLIRLTDDIRTLSELEHPSRTLDFKSVMIEDVIIDVMGIFRRQADKKGLLLDVEIGKELPPINADRYSVEQVLVNLLENAIRYTSSGSVTVRTDLRGKYVTIVVADTGSGISQEHLPRLFERFYVVDRARSRSRGGTGLGLAIVKHIMTVHGGWVRASSTPGEGSMFTVAFPVHYDRGSES